MCHIVGHRHMRGWPLPGQGDHCLVRVTTAWSLVRARCALGWSVWPLSTEGRWMMAWGVGWAEVTRHQCVVTSIGCCWHQIPPSHQPAIGYRLYAGNNGEGVFERASRRNGNSCVDWWRNIQSNIASIKKRINKHQTNTWHIQNN